LEVVYARERDYRRVVTLRRNVLRRLERRLVVAYGITDL